MDDESDPTSQGPTLRSLQLRLLELEYSTLRSEMSNLLNHRLQAPTIFTVAAGLVFGFAPKDSGFTLPVVIGVAGTLAMLGIASWIDSGLTIGRLSRHLAQIEQDLNDLVAGDFVATHVMSWETKRQTSRNVWRRISFGRGEPPTARRSQ